MTGGTTSPLGLERTKLGDTESEKNKFQPFENPAQISNAKDISLIDQDFPVEIFWKNVFLCTLLHISAIYGFYLGITGKVMWQTVVWVAFLFVFAGFGITAGCHRYWAHRSYKAALPLRMLLAIMQTFGFQYSIYDWSRTHRIHHKYTETNADPHNVKRGFFFAQLGWLLVKEHPAVTQKRKEMILSDLESDSIVMFQHKYYWELVYACVLFILTVCIVGWGESLESAWFFAACYNFCVSMNITGLVNSAAHLWGSKPYDKRINPSDNLLVAFLSGGEGSHNYHHTFPWDYKTDELGHYYYNPTAAFLDVMAWIGWAYDLKTVSKKVVTARAGRTGDGSHPAAQAHHEELHHHGGGPWGWGDADIPKSDAEVTQTLYSFA